MTDTSNLMFTQNHEWILLRKDKTAIVGITDFGQSILSQVTHVDVPEPDEQVHEAGEEIGVIESIRNSFPFHCPVAGVITASNRNLLSAPELINEDPFGEGWIFEMKIDDPSEVEDLMSPDEYESHLPEDDEE